MRSFTLPILACLIALTSFGQGNIENGSPTDQAQPQISVLKLNSEFPALASTPFQSPAERPLLATAARGSCEKYQHMKITGIILASVGGGALIIGAVMANVGYADAFNNGYHSNGDWGLIAGGTVLIVGGVACLGAGIPLAIIGGVKAHKNCGGGRGGALLNLHSGRNGTGLALNF